MTTPTRLAYLVTHPIQYQVPMLRRIAAQSGIKLTVFFQSDLSVSGYHDTGFGRPITWDVPLLGGYDHEFLPALGRRDVVDLHRPISYGLAGRLLRGDFDVLWVHGYARWFNWVAMLTAKAVGVKILVRDESSAVSSHRSAAKVAAKRVFLKVLDSVADGFLAIGTLNRRYYLDNGIEPGRIDLMPYSVDNDWFEERARAAAPDRETLRSRLGRSPGRPVVLFASKFQARKRPGDLLAAYRKVVSGRTAAARPYLLFVGDGELSGQLQADAADLHDDVRFLGFQNQSALPALFDLCDVFVLPSEREPWGLIVNEVMTVGRAVIVTDDVGCAADLVQDGVNGRVVPVGNIGALAEALADVLSNPERTNAMGRAGAERIAGWSYAEDITGLLAALRRVTGRAQV